MSLSFPEGGIGQKVYRRASGHQLNTSTALLCWQEPGGLIIRLRPMNYGGQVRRVPFTWNLEL